jgi:hypothetical protein
MACNCAQNFVQGCNGTGLLCSSLPVDQLQCSLHDESAAVVHHPVSDCLSSTSTQHQQFGQIATDTGHVFRHDSSDSMHSQLVTTS